MTGKYLLEYTICCIVGDYDMKMNLKKIIGAYGESLPFSYEADLKDMELYGEHPFQEGVKISGQIVNHLGVLKAEGVVETVYHTSCARCAKPLLVPIRAEESVILARHENAQEEDEVFVVQGEEVELDDIFVPALILQVDMTYLCREDCKGLCPKCGKDLNEGSCGCSTFEIDDRLAILQTLLDKDKN